MPNNHVDFTPKTVGELRKALEGIPDDVELLYSVNDIIEEECFHVQDDKTIWEWECKFDLIMINITTNGFNK